VTLDLDSFDSEVYGRLKQGAAFNYRGQRCYDTQLATWAERRRILAVELRPGNLNEHPTAIKLVRRARKALLQSTVGCGPGWTAASRASPSSRNCGGER
jgi:hypothetical protein